MASCLTYNVHLIIAILSEKLCSANCRSSPAKKQAQQFEVYMNCKDQLQTLSSNIDNRQHQQRISLCPPASKMVPLAARDGDHFSMQHTHNNHLSHTKRFTV